MRSLRRSCDFFSQLRVTVRSQFCRNCDAIENMGYETGDMMMLQFCESLARSLLLDVPFENLKPALRESSTIQTKHKFVDCKLEEMEECDCDVRRRCAGYYATSYEDL
ncbi:hypothetical protein I4U23_022863 [Adineta vaga]|nr:hypothetical protein I4U23_022863 [Adineta vaga]